MDNNYKADYVNRTIVALKYFELKKPTKTTGNTKLVHISGVYGEVQVEFGCLICKNTTKLINVPMHINTYVYVYACSGLCTLHISVSCENIH